MPAIVLPVQTPISISTDPTPPTLPGGVQEVATKVRDMLARGAVDPHSAISIIRATTEVAQSVVGPSRKTSTNIVDIIEAVIIEIAKGRDGVLGTADDLISADILDILQSMLNQRLVRDLAAWVTDVAVVSCIPKFAWIRHLMFWKL